MKRPPPAPPPLHAQIEPAFLSDEFWEAFTQRVLLWQDTLVSLVTLGFLPLM